MGVVTLIVLFVISLLVLFTSMILSAMASHQASIGNAKLAQRYSMISAVTNGITWGLIVLTFILYLYREKICRTICNGATKLQSAFDETFQSLP